MSNMQTFSDCISVEEHDSVFILKMFGGNKQQNALNVGFLKAFNNALDFCLSIKGEKALIITGKNDKFFSVGLDFKQLLHSKDANVLRELGYLLFKTLSRLLIFGLPTIAVINGHCYAGGLFIAFCCDYRIGLNNCGTLCLSELVIEKDFPNGLAEIIKNKLSPIAARDCAYAKKFNIKQALDAQIIDKMVMKREDLLNESIKFAKTVASYSKNKKNFSKIKRQLYSEAYEPLNRACKQMSKLSKL
eukprot:190573_1